MEADGVPVGIQTGHPSNTGFSPNRATREMMECNNIKSNKFACAEVTEGRKTTGNPPRKRGLHTWFPPAFRG
jgi:hypothetical protein